MTHPDPNTRSTTEETLDDARRAGSDVAGTVKDSAHDAAGTISAEASRAADRAQSGAADEVGDVASALRTAAGELRSGSPQDRAFSHLADNLADVSDAIRDKDMADLLSDLNGFARRNPLAFLGGAALVGFAATRVAKASAEATARTGTPKPTPGTSTMPTPGPGPDAIDSGV